MNKHLFHIKKVKLKPAGSALGLASHPYKIDLKRNRDELVNVEIPIDAELCLKLEVNLPTIILYRWDDTSERFHKVVGSKLDDQWKHIQARIHESGIYVAAGASSNPWVNNAMATLRTLRPLLHNRKTEPIIRKQICQVILCPQMLDQIFNKIGDPQQYGLPSLPGRDICEICMGGNLGHTFDLYPNSGFSFQFPEFPDIPIPKIPSGGSPCIQCNLEAYLQSNPYIKKRIIWRDPSPRTYYSWTESEKADLAMAFNTIRAGGDMDLPETADATASSDDSLKVYLTSDVAWKVYIAYLAHTLVVEICGWVDWSIVDYSHDELLLLLDSDAMFTSLNDGQYLMQVSEHGNASHGDPTRVYRWLRQEELIASDPLNTIGRVLEWCRDHLVHYVGGPSPDNMESHWQYRGFPPVERIIGGTESQFGFNHWTAGCWGTSGFLRLVLRTINLPATFKIICLHALPFFPTIGRYLSHGDDPYNQNTREVNAAGTEMLIDQATYEAWFDPANPEKCDNIGRRPRELVENV